MLNTEYDRDYCFDIDAYLIENYSLMDMSTRRTVCQLVLSEIDDAMIEETIDDFVAQHAVSTMAWAPSEETDEE
tara:strand:- start:48 stop:269 length:222 start_codon:yes stop_codon:yes gene_type:complete